MPQIIKQRQEIIDFTDKSNFLDINLCAYIEMLQSNLSTFLLNY
jgi:hypothetical protein